MARKNLELILKKYLASLRHKETAGFTLMELLMAILVGGIITYAMLSLVVSLLTTEKRETAKSQVQQQMAQAMDYITAEVQQAIYIYPDKDTLLNEGLQLEAGDEPVLAFWKATAIEGDDLTELEAGNCEDPTSSSTCKLLWTNLHTYNLVIYALKNNAADEIWEGKARIRRYELKEYKEFTTPTRTDGYGSFSVTTLEWEPTSTITTWSNSGEKWRTELVDSLDDGEDPAPECPDGYTATIDVNGDRRPDRDNFYACVKPHSKGSVQDAIVGLRGTAAEQAGQPSSENSAYFPTIERRVEARAVFGRQRSQ